MEIWRDIEGYEGYYEVSNYGNVRSVSRYINSAILHQDRIFMEGRVLKQCTAGRYNGVSLSKNNIIKRRNVHVLVARAFPETCGEWFDGCVVDHVDGNARNNNAENLRVTTQYGNIHNPISEKRRVSAVVKSTGMPVNAKKNGVVIRSFPSAMQAAEFFSVSDGTIRNIIRGKSNFNVGYELEFA